MSTMPPPLSSNTDWSMTLTESVEKPGNFGVQIRIEHPCLGLTLAPMAEQTLRGLARSMLAAADVCAKANRDGRAPRGH